MTEDDATRFMVGFLTALHEGLTGGASLVHGYLADADCEHIEAALYMVGSMLLGFWGDSAAETLTAMGAAVGAREP